MFCNHPPWPAASHYKNITHPELENKKKVASECNLHSSFVSSKGYLAEWINIRYKCALDETGMDHNNRAHAPNTGVRVIFRTCRHGYSQAWAVVKRQKWKGYSYTRGRGVCVHSHISCFLLLPVFMPSYSLTDMSIMLRKWTSVSAQTSSALTHSGHGKSLRAEWLLLTIHFPWSPVRQSNLSLTSSVSWSPQSEPSDSPVGKGLINMACAAIRLMQRNMLLM